MCCSGCAAAAEFIAAQGLDRFYQFRETPVSKPLRDQGEWQVFDRASALRRFTHRRADGTLELGVQLEGLHCAACVWLIESSLRRVPGLLDISVNLAESRAQVHFDPRRVALSTLLSTLARLGYTPHPIGFLESGSDGMSERRAALRRLAVAGLGMMQVMSFAAALYAGALDGMDPAMRVFLRYVSLVVASPVVLYSAQPFFLGAWRGLRRRTLGMDVPVALSIAAAYMWSLWATLVNRGPVYFDSAVMFTFFLLLGRYVELTLRHRAGRQQDSLARLLPDSVLRISGDVTEAVTPQELQPGDLIRVLPGTRLPADGKIATGTSEIDEALLTGESAPRIVQPGSTVCAGTLNLNGILEVRIERVGTGSTLAAVTRLLDRAQAERPPVAALADRVAAWFVGVVLLLAAVAGAYWWRTDPSHAFSVVLAVLVVTCPCALSLATPVALAAAITRLAQSGLLVVHGRALERLATANCVVLDKTGTLTRGQTLLDALTPLGERVDASRCLAVAAALEMHSTHPIAYAFRDVIPAGSVEQPVVSPGRGVEARVGGTRYRIGTLEFAAADLPADSIRFAGPATDSRQSEIFLADEFGLLARFSLTDALRHDAAETLTSLQDLGLVTRIASGDREAIVADYAQQLRISTWQAAMSAADKVALVRRLQQDGGRVVMVGDGINDAPVLAAADVSVALGSGADLAQVSADIVLLGDGLAPLAQAIPAARRMMQIVRQNLAWALVYNLTAIPLAVSGLLQPWTAAIGMSASSLLVVMNALRLVPSRPAASHPKQHPPGPISKVVTA